MSRISFRLAVTALGVFLIALGGCVNLGEGTKQSPRFYVLDSPFTPRVQKKVYEDKECLAIGLGPVNLPQYLNRPQIVTRVSPNELKADEFHRWAEPLKDNVARVLRMNLSNLLCIKSLTPFPWRAVKPIDYRIEVDVIRMDGNLGGDVELIARWSIHAENEKGIVVSKENAYRESVKPRSYEGLVSAHSKTLAALSLDMAEALKDLSSKGGRVSSP